MKSVMKAKEHDRHTNGAWTRKQEEEKTKRRRTLKKQPTVRRMTSKDSVDIE